MAFSFAVDSRGKGYGWQRLIKGALCCLWVSVAVSGRAEGFSFNDVGVRSGFGGNTSSAEFREIEVFSDVNLPWGWDLGRSLRLDSRLDLGVGWLGDRGANAALGEVGPLLVLSYKQFPVTLAAGSNATGLSRSAFKAKDLGIAFQFTTHIGLNWDFAQHLRLGYRYQHTSNAGLDGSNPGLNMHMVGLSYLF